MASRFEIVQSVENEAEAGKPVNVELRIFDVGMMGFKLDLWVESGRTFFGDLGRKELAVEVAEVDCIQVYDMDLTKAGKDKVLQQFAADTASTDQQDSRL
ncbi:MAG: hypothetical protein Q9219_001779 [cf. Caloplaca sp. 3 TL-2023]